MLAIRRTNSAETAHSTGSVRGERWRRTSWALALVCLASLSVIGCKVLSLPIWKPQEPVAAVPYSIETIRDVEYARDPVDPSERHRLDVFYPKGKRNFPIVVLVHGGAWMMGDNRCCGLYSSVGEFLAGQGFGVVMPNYRLSPGVKHPAHIKDLARAVRWAHTHMPAHGGQADQLVLIGHSAGGHLVTLLSTDESYLRAVGMDLQDIRGTVGVSGVYEVAPEKLSLSLGGEAEGAFHLTQIIPLRGNGFPDPTGPLAGWGVPISLDAYGLAFEEDPEERVAASPLHHVQPGLSPFLLISAEQDLPTLPAQATTFQQALIEAGCDAKLERIPNRNHNSILFSATHKQDPVAQLILRFVQARTEQ